jgi:ribosomal-protein-alanine N-acetyltransferase
VAEDFDAWREVRRRCADWLLKWEPARIEGYPDPVEDRRAFAARCGARERERQMGNGYGFAVFVGDRFAGEMNLSGIQRGPFQNGFIGYWIDEAMAGHGYTPEAAAVLLRFAFEDLGLHRLQVAIIPRNTASRRVVAKLGLREEGIAERLLEINGVWEDHVCYAVTSEEWDELRKLYEQDWF